MARQSKYNERASRAWQRRAACIIIIVSCSGSAQSNPPSKSGRPLGGKNNRPFPSSPSSSFHFLFILICLSFTSNDLAVLAGLLATGRWRHRSYLSLDRNLRCIYCDLDLSDFNDTRTRNFGLVIFTLLLNYYSGIFFLVWHLFSFSFWMTNEEGRSMNSFKRWICVCVLGSCLLFNLNHL